MAARPLGKAFVQMGKKARSVTMRTSKAQGGGAKQPTAKKEVPSVFRRGNS